MTPPRSLLPASAALLIGLLSGALAERAALPLPWMLGAMIGTTLAALLRLPISGPDRLRPIVIPTIGVLLGSQITAETLAGLRTGWPALLLLPPFLLAAGGASYLVYRRLGRLDRASAFFSAMPGGLNDMMLLGELRGGDGRRIALAHATRILVVITLVVVAYGLLFDVTTGGPAGAWTGLAALSPADWAILGLCGAAGALGGARIGLPAAAVFGPMLLSGAAHVAGIVAVAPPTLLVIAAQVVVGTVVGCRFLGTAPRLVLRDLGLGALASLAMLGVAIGFALILRAGTGMALALGFLAYSPGGLTEMSLLALAMEQDVAFVTGLHLVRLILVIGGAAAAWQLFARRG